MTLTLQQETIKREAKAQAVFFETEDWERRFIKLSPLQDLGPRVYGERLAEDTSKLAEVLGFTYAPFEELLRSSDVISLHVPLNKATHHMVNRDNIGLIKRGALLINTSRGAVVETEALISALNEGIIAGVGLDVFEGEESIKEETELLVQGLPGDKMREILLSYALLHRENVVITPHIAFYSQEALQRIMQTTQENILGFLEGRPVNVVAA